MMAWSSKSLGELFRVGSSRRVLQSQWQSEGVPFYRGREITLLAVEGVVNNALFISEDLYAEFSAKNGVPSAGDIMITAIGTIGNSYIVQDSDRFYFKDASVLWLKKTTDVSSYFINWWLKSPLFFEQLDRGNGATVDTLTIQKLQTVAVNLPPLPEQQRIVTLLDEAFDGIAIARAHAEKNLQNARAIFESQLQSVFTQRGDGWIDKSFGELADFRNGINFTQSSVGDPVKILGVKDFQSNYWAPLDNLESITPDGKLSDLETLQSDDLVFVRSNGNPELIGRCLLIGEIPERTTHSGFTIRARLRGTELSPTYLCHFLKSKRVRKEMVDGGNGANIRSLNQGTLSRLVIPVPSVKVQMQIVVQLEALSAESQRLESLYQRKIAALDELKKSLLAQAFSGQLTSAQQTRQPLQTTTPTTTPEFTANVICFAHARHERLKREKTFGHVKEQKVLHLIESIAGIDLGRCPMKDAAGPNDFAHMLKAEEWAKAQGFFAMVKRDGGYDFQKLSAFDEHLSRTREALAPYLAKLERVIDLLVPMDSEEAEIFATVHAAWNNLLIDKLETTDDAIVSAAREGWHAEKLKISERKFRHAIEQIRQKCLVPDGTAKYVGQPRLL